MSPKRFIPRTVGGVLLALCIAALILWAVAFITAINIGEAVFK